LLIAAGVQAGVESCRIQAQVGGELLQARQAEAALVLTALVGEERIRVVPEAALLVGALRSLSSVLRLWPQEGHVPEDVMHFACAGLQVGLLKLADDLGGVSGTEGALEVRVFLNDHRRVWRPHGFALGIGARLGRDHFCLLLQAEGDQGQYAHDSYSDDHVEHLAAGPCLAPRADFLTPGLAGSHLYLTSLI